MDIVQRNPTATVLVSSSAISFENMDAELVAFQVQNQPKIVQRACGTFVVDADADALKEESNWYENSHVHVPLCTITCERHQTRTILGPDCSD